MKGLNPYELPHQSSYLSTLAAPSPVDSQIHSSDPLLRVWTPPYVFSLLWPLGTVSLNFACRAFSFFFCFSTIFSLLMCLTEDGKRGFTQMTFIICASLPIGLFYEGLAIGSVSAIALLGLTLSMYYADRDAMFLSGFCLMLTAIKLHLFLMLYFALFLWVLSNRNWRFARGAISGLLLLIVLPLVFRPEVYQLYLNAPPMELPIQITNTSWTNLLSNYLPMPRTLALTLLVLIPLAVTCWTRRWWLRWSYRTMVPIFVPLSLICAPFAWSHDYIVCIPFFVLMAKLATESLHNRKFIEGSLFISALLLWQLLDIARIKFQMFGYLALFGSISLLPILAAMVIWLGDLKMCPSGFTSKRERSSH